MARDLLLLSHDGWFAEMPPAVAEAQRTGLDLLIDFGGSEWCAPTTKPD